MKFEVLARKRSTTTRPPLPARVLAELETLADLWGNPGDDVDARPPSERRETVLKKERSRD